MKCWACLEGLMEEAKDLGEGWYRCLKCGVTWTKVSKKAKKSKKVKK